VKSEKPKDRTPCEARLTIEAYENSVARVVCQLPHRHPGPHQGTVSDPAWNWVRIEFGDFSE